MIDEPSDSEYANGLDAFTEEEKVFCEVMAKEAKGLANKFSGTDAVNKLMELGGRVMAARDVKHEHGVNICSPRAYFFCMTWLAGACSIADSEEDRKGGLSMTHCGIAFLAGAAIVTVFNLI